MKITAGQSLLALFLLTPPDVYPARPAARAARSWLTRHASQEGVVNMKNKNFFANAAVAAVLGLGMAAGAQAALVTVHLPETGKDNDCSGLFGTSPNCNVTGPTGTKFSPLIVKYDMNDDGDAIVKTTINSTLFPSFSGSEISFSGGDVGSGTWTYTQGAGDPSIRYWTAKAGASFNLFWVVADADLSTACTVVYSDACLAKALVVTSGSFTTPDFKNLSHIGFYDTKDELRPPVPLPAAAWLLISGLLGLGALGRRKTAA